MSNPNLDSPRRFFILHWVSLALSVSGAVMLLLGRGHYSIDVVLAYYVSTRLWWVYHSLANNTSLRYTRGYLLAFRLFFIGLWGGITFWVSCGGGGYLPSGRGKFPVRCLKNTASHFPELGESGSASGCFVARDQQKQLKTSNSDIGNRRNFEKSYSKTYKYNSASDIEFW